MAKSDSLHGALDLLILKALSLQGPVHGYALMSAIRGYSREILRVEEGSLYPALHRLEEEGWIKGTWITKDSGYRSRVYQLTATGKKRLATETEKWAEVSNAILQVLRMA
jgi:PadR family transcriptional regulator, regulatory protein PadR